MNVWHKYTQTPTFKYEANTRNPPSLNTAAFDDDFFDNDAAKREATTIPSITEKSTK